MLCVPEYKRRLLLLAVPYSVLLSAQHAHSSYPMLVAGVVVVVVSCDAATAAGGGRGNAISRACGWKAHAETCKSSIKLARRVSGTVGARSAAEWGLLEHVWSVVCFYMHVFWLGLAPYALRTPEQRERESPIACQTCADRYARFFSEGVVWYKV